MNIHLSYWSGQSYSQMFNNFDIKASGSSGRRAKISFREKAENSRSYASFSLAPDEARQLAYALLFVTSSAEVNEIEFAVAERSSKTVAA